MAICAIPFTSMTNLPPEEKENGEIKLNPSVSFYYYKTIL